MFVMQTCAMKACFQIAECSFSSAKISNIPVTSKYLAGYFIVDVVGSVSLAYFYLHFVG